jgi:diacylglycerol kinase family enzyme
MLSERRRVQVVVNANASGIDSVRSTVRDATLALEHAGAETSAVATRSLRELREAIAESDGRRLVLVGGDGAVHAVANAGATGEIALLPAGRANNIARGLGIPSSWRSAAAIAVGASTRPLDLLSVKTADRSLLAVEGFSAGFQAAARSRYTAENSADLGAGVVALMRALATHRPYAVELEVDGEALSLSASQLFLANMPLFGFGFRVAPGARPDDGEADLVVLPPRSRGTILPELARVREGRHLAGGRALLRRVRRIELRSPLPLVADAEVLGHGTAVVELVPGALRLARPRV